MTSPSGSRGPSPLKVGGLALLGVGVVAGALGLIGLNSGGSDVPPVAAPSISTSAVPETALPAADATPPADAEAPPAAAAAPPAAAPAPAPAVPAPAPLTTAPAPAPPAAAGGAGAVPVAATSPVRVYNNSTITGLAAGAADDFRNAGWTVDSVANYSSGIIPSSTVYYRPGTPEQTSAERIGTEFGLRAEPRFAGLADASPGLIVIVTNDYQRR